MDWSMSATASMGLIRRTVVALAICSLPRGLGQSRDMMAAIERMRKRQRAPIVRWLGAGDSQKDVILKVVKVLCFVILWRVLATVHSTRVKRFLCCMDDN